MFSAQTYSERRQQLQQLLPSGLMLFLGNGEAPMNYAANTYHFRQDSSFAYFFGLKDPDLVGLVDGHDGRAMIFGSEADMDDIIWMGPQPSLAERARQSGVTDTHPLSSLPEFLAAAKKKKRKIHYLPPYRAEHVLHMEKLLNIRHGQVRDSASSELIQAVIRLRSLKTAEEIDQIEKALAVTKEMYDAIFAMARPGTREYEIVGRIDGIAQQKGCRQAFPPIVTVNGQTLHNHYYGNVLPAGRLLLADTGAESPLGYAADITRTAPISGKFSEQQRAVYEIVLRGQMTAIQAIRPGVSYRDIHLMVCRTMTEGLIALGLMKGNPAEAVAAGAHALFFPHGLGHMMGLDVHDMENLGEQHVGYDETVQRSEQFGLAYLRLAKKLEPGFVLTVEPGLYFIPALIERWQQEKNHLAFIQYDELVKYRDFGGVRIEDDVLVTQSGGRVLGPAIRKTVAEIEAH